MSETSDNCVHQFVIVKEIDNVKSHLFGVVVVCPLCGEVRHVWENGNVEIKGTYL